MLKFLEEEYQTYSIDNSLSAAEDICYRLVRNILRYADENEIILIRTGLREIIINAIEHGNLQISFNDKSEAMRNGNYYSLLQTRQNSPENIKKKVKISYELNQYSVKYIITDEGLGFSKEEKNAGAGKNNTGFHGRGILMAKNIFDTIKYNKSGNSVTLVKKFNLTK